MDDSFTKSRPLFTRSDLLPLLLLFFLGLFFHKAMLLGSGVIVGDDELLHHLPTAKLLYESVEAGRLPFWSPQIMLGYPVYAEGQAGVFYPPTTFLYRATVHAVKAGFRLPPGPPWRFPLVLELFLHHVMLAWLMYLLARELGSSPAASFLAAVACAYGGFTVSHLIHQNIVRSLCYLPLLWLWSLRAMRAGDAGGARDIAFHGVALALLFLAGHHQSAIQIGLAWVIWIAFLERGSAPTTWVRRTAWRTLTPTVLGIGLAAVQLWPTYELWSVSARAGAATAAERLPWSYTPYAWRSWLLPFLQGSEQAAHPYFGPGLFHELTSYIGVVPLCVLAAARPWSAADRLARFLGAFALLGTLLSAGPFSPTFFVHWLPPFSLFRNPCRFLMWVEFALALLSARALDMITLPELTPAQQAFLARFTAVRILTLGALFVLASTALFKLTASTPRAPSVPVGPNLPPKLSRDLSYTRVVRDDRPEFSRENLRTDARARTRLAFSNAATGATCAMMLAVLARCALTGQAHGQLSPTYTAVSLAFLGVVDSVGLFANRVWDVSDFKTLIAEPGPIEFLRTRVPTDRFAFEAFREVRPVPTHVRWRRMAANLYSNVASATGLFSPLTPRSYSEFFRSADAPPLGADAAVQTLARLDVRRDQWKLSLASVSWILTTEMLSSLTLLPRMSEDDITLYRNLPSLPRLYIVRSMRDMKQGEVRDQTLAALASKFPCVTIERPGKPDLLAGAVLTQRDSVSLTESHPEEVYALANLSAPAWLILADQSYPGWRVIVSGKEQPLYTACGVFRAVELPRGISDVRFTFEPQVFVQGVRVTLGALALTIVLLGMSLFTIEPVPPEPQAEGGSEVR